MASFFFFLSPRQLLVQLPETFKSSGASMLGKILKSVYVEESFTIYDNEF